MLISSEGGETEDGRLEIPFVGDVVGLFAVFGIIVEIDIWKTCSDLSVS